MSFSHQPVLLTEVLDGLSPATGEIVFDGTLGLGGHSAALAKCIGSSGRLIASEWDDRNRALAEDHLKPYSQITIVSSPFSRIREIAAEQKVSSFDVILFDLGLSSAHLDDADRGFSFRFDAPLDLRMNSSLTRTAADILREGSYEELADIFYYFGEERKSRLYAKRILDARETAPITRTTELLELISHKNRQPRKTAARIFQALRIAVNDELGEIEKAIPDAFELLSPGGRMAVISFHSLEDRFIKQRFRGWENEGLGQRINKKIIIPSDEEQEQNPRSRSAKLRLITKC